MRNPHTSRSAVRVAGEDDEDPYEGIDIDTLPDWWQRNIKEYQVYGMRSYRPPRFVDGTLLPPCIEEIESKYDIDLRIMMKDPEDDNKADIIIEGDTICEIQRTREPEGYTVYELTSVEFDHIIQSHVSEFQ